MLEGNGWTGRASVDWRWERKDENASSQQGKGKHQSLISGTLESRPTFFCKYLALTRTPEPFTPEASTVAKRTCVLFHGTCVLLMCSRDCNVPDGLPRWFVKNDGTSAGDSINDALAVVTSSLCAEEKTLTRRRTHKQDIMRRQKTDFL